MAEANITVTQLSKLTGWSTDAIGAWKDGKGVNRTIYNSLCYGLEELRDEGSTLNLQDLKERLGHHAPKSGNFVGPVYGIGL